MKIGQEQEIIDISDHNLIEVNLKMAKTFETFETFNYTLTGGFQNKENKLLVKAAHMKPMKAFQAVREHYILAS